VPAVTTPTGLYILLETAARMRINLRVSHRLLLLRRRNQRDLSDRQKLNLKNLKNIYFSCFGLEVESESDYL